jgi:hypothetical protein
MHAMFWWQQGVFEGRPYGGYLGRITTVLTREGWLVGCSTMGSVMPGLVILAHVELLSLCLLLHVMTSGLAEEAALCCL